jgi:hypothetical protein
MNPLSNTIKRYIPLVGRKPKIERKQALAIIPVRHPLVKWEWVEGEVVLSIPMRTDGIARVIKSIIKATRVAKELPEYRQLSLDEVGSQVWELCDGERTIDGVVREIVHKQKLVRREAEASVTMFLQTLAKRNLIGLMSAGGKKSVNNKRK